MPDSRETEPGAGQRREHRHRRGELADVAQVDVESRVGLRPAHFKVRIRLFHNGIQLPKDAQNRLGGLDAGRRPAGDANRARADHGRGDERDGIGQVRFDVPVPRRDDAGPHLPTVGCRVVDVHAGLAQHRHRHGDVRRRRQRRTAVLHGQAVGERRAGEQQAGDELRRRRGVDVHSPAGDRSGAAHPERQAVAVDVDAQAAQRIQQRRDRPDPGLLVAVEGDRRQTQRRQRRDETQHRAGQAAVDAGSGGGAIVPLTASSSAGPSTRRPSASSAPIIRSVSRLRSAPLIVETPPLAAASAESTNARLVWDFEPGTVTVAYTGVGVGGAVQVLIVLHHCLSAGSATMESCVDDSQ